MFDLATFSLGDMVECSSTVRRLGAGAASVEQAASRVVDYLFENLVVRDSGKRACALVRFYKTHPCATLDDELNAFARRLLPETPFDPETKCLVLVATRGVVPEWNSRHASQGHRVIPLPSHEAVERSPMISQLIAQFGLNVNTVIGSDPDLFLDLDQRTFNVFYVPKAAGSPHVPAQDEFVAPYGIESVLGFGGVIPPGDLFATVLFSRTHIPRETADMFKTVALSVKLAVLDAGERLFE